jgi:hypothetical protein
MRLLRVAMTASLIMAGLIGCASSHTKPRHEYGTHSHSYSYSYSGAPTHRHSYPHGSGHDHEHSRWSAHGHHYGERHPHPHVYHRPPPAPGRTPDGRYVLPGGLESVCAGGTPPPCQ